MSTVSPYRVHCECGNDLPVESSSAGGTVVCRCGRDVRVPRLSELRRGAGEVTPIQLSACERIRLLLLDGGLPPDQVCRITQRPTSDVIHLTVVCEQPRMTGGRSWWWMWIAGAGTLLVSWWFLPIYLLTRGTPQVVVTPETVFRLPIPVASDRQVLVRDYRQSELRELLRTVPLYADLLAEFPQARITVG